MKLQLSFGKSRAAAYKDVIRLCSVFDGFDQKDDTNVLTLTLKDVTGHWSEFNGIFHAICKWSSFRCIVDDTTSINTRQAKLVFYNLQDLMYCMKEFHQVQHKEYCAGTKFWGCKKLQSVQVLPDFYSGDKGWYTFGHLSDGDWNINKEAILQRLLQEAKERMIDQCPNFNKEQIRRVVKALPDKIDIATRNWKLVTGVKFIDGEFKSVCTGLKWIGSYAEYKPETFLTK